MIHLFCCAGIIMVRDNKMVIRIDKNDKFTEIFKIRNFNNMSTACIVATVWTFVYLWGPLRKASYVVFFG